MPKEPVDLINLRSRDPRDTQVCVAEIVIDVGALVEAARSVSTGLRTLDRSRVIDPDTLRLLEWIEGMLAQVEAALVTMPEPPVRGRPDPEAS